MTGPDRRPVSAWIRRLAWVGWVLVAAFAMLEAVVRLRAWKRYGTAEVARSVVYYDTELDLRVPRPGYELKGSRIHIKINSLGFRGDDLGPRTADTVRIACLGASTTFGSEVSDNSRTWPHQMQLLLQERHPSMRVEVINAGVPGYRVEHSLRNLERRVLPLEPDIVIVYHANNDIVHDTLELATRQGLVQRRGTSGWLRRLTKYSVAADLLAKNLLIRSGGRQRVNGRLEQLPDTLPDRFITELGKIHGLLQEHETRLVLSTFLVKLRRDQPQELQERNADVAFYYMPWMSTSLLLEAVDRYNGAVLRFATEAGIPVLQETDSIPADDEHFADYMHLTDEGSAVMAERFAAFLSENGLLEAKPRGDSGASHRHSAIRGSPAP